jgi:hypothetical protein
MVSAIGRLMPDFVGILQRFCKAVLPGQGARRLVVCDLPDDLRRDVGLEMVEDVWHAREQPERRLLDLTRPGQM